MTSWLIHIDTPKPYLIYAIKMENLGNFQVILFFIFKDFFIWTIFKVFKGIWNLNSLTRDQTHTFCTGRWSLNHWTTREVSWPWFILILQLNTFVRIPLILPLGIPCSVSRFHNSVSQTSWLPPTLPRTVIITSTFPLTFKHCHLARGVG